MNSCCPSLFRGSGALHSELRDSKQQAAAAVGMTTCEGSYSACSIRQIGIDPPDFELVASKSQCLLLRVYTCLVVCAAVNLRQGTVAPGHQDRCGVQCSTHIVAQL